MRAMKREPEVAPSTFQPPLVASAVTPWSMVKALSLARGSATSQRLPGWTVSTHCVSGFSEPSTVFDSWEAVTLKRKSKSEAVETEAGVEVAKTTPLRVSCSITPEPAMGRRRRRVAMISRMRSTRSGCPRTGSEGSGIMGRASPLRGGCRAGARAVQGAIRSWRS